MITKNDIRKSLRNLARNIQGCIKRRIVKDDPNLRMACAVIINDLDYRKHHNLKAHMIMVRHRRRMIQLMYDAYHHDDKLNKSVKEIMAIVDALCRSRTDAMPRVSKSTSL